jgi:integration host factor subunit alpha
MTQSTINRADLCEAVYKNTRLSRTESAMLVELVLREITACLERGESVKLSSFGSFMVRNKRQRMGTNRSGPDSGAADPGI